MRPGVLWRLVGSLVLMSTARAEASAQASAEFDRSVLRARESTRMLPNIFAAPHALLLDAIVSP